jgi:hypothetical protein
VFTSSILLVSSWNINGVYRKTCGTKANKIHDDEFQKIKKSDVIFLSEIIPDNIFLFIKTTIPPLFLLESIE